MDTRTLSNTDILRELGERYRQYRIAAGYTQAEMADMSGVSASTLRKFENGSAFNMTVQNLFSLMRHTGLLQHADSLIPELPDNPYFPKLKTRRRVRHD